MKNELLNLALPKWPMMKVTGVPVTADQAWEILRRTDYFFVYGHGGNNHQYDRKWKLRLGMRLESYEQTDKEEKKYGSEEERIAALNLEWRMQELWREIWGGIETGYVHNDWVSCSYIFGPHGWCHPDGQIGFIDNVGKWPNVGEIYEDWKRLAKEFPFLDLGVTLMNAEHSEDIIEPVVSLVIRKGRVRLVDPAKKDVHKGHPEPHRTSGGDDTRYKALFGGEQGMPDEYMERYVKHWEKLKPAYDKKVDEMLKGTAAEQRLKAIRKRRKVTV